MIHRPSEEATLVSSFLDSLDRTLPDNTEEDLEGNGPSMRGPIFTGPTLGGGRDDSENLVANNLSRSFFDVLNARQGLDPLQTEATNSDNNEPRVPSADRIIVERLTADLRAFQPDTSFSREISQRTEEDDTALTSDLFNFMDSMRTDRNGPVPPDSLFQSRVGGNPFENTHRLLTNQANAPPSSLSLPNTRFDSNPWGPSDSISFGNAQNGEGESFHRPRLLSASFREALRELQQNPEQENARS